MQAVIFIESNGKSATWGRVADALRINARIVATNGAVFRYPDALFPLGISFTPGSKVDPGRVAIKEKVQHIERSIRNLPEECALLIATDDDSDGDVIALDIATVIAQKFPSRKKQMVRVRPGPITIDGVRAAIAQGEKINSEVLVESATYGRARMASDRWVNSTFSCMTGYPISRVRTALLGATHVLNNIPQNMAAFPETGEITFQARSPSGGLPFVARVSINGFEDPARLKALVSLATKFKGKIVPGVVRTLQPAGAAIAPRMGSVTPFNTVDALAYAIRHFGVSAKDAMRGLNDAYRAGILSYPRTDSRKVSVETASRVARLGVACGIRGLDATVLSEDPVNIKEARLSDVRHEALHPVMALSTRNAQLLGGIIRKPIRAPQQGWDQTSIRDLMITLVTRRCFEASRRVEMERGNWHPDNLGTLSPEETMILRDLEWSREKSFSYPWSRDLLTAVRPWPASSVLLEIMAAEGLGRPANFAQHLTVSLASGTITEGEFPAPPRPTQTGLAVLRKVKDVAGVSVWNPLTCRIIERVLLNQDNLLGEDKRLSVSARAQLRMGAWVRHVPADMGQKLAGSLFWDRDKSKGARA